MKLTGPWWTNDEALKPDAEHPPQETLFRAEFEGSGTARLQIAAQNFYQCWLNGHWLGYGPARASHGRLTVDEWGLPAKWCQEKNTLAIQVLWEGIFVFDHVRGTPGLWFGIEREDVALPVELLATTKAGRTATHRSSHQRGWAEEIDDRQRVSGWPCGAWETSEWSQPVLRQSDPPVVLESRDIAPYAVHVRRAQSVVFAGVCDLRNGKTHRAFPYESLPLFGDGQASPSRQLQEEALLPGRATDWNLAALTASGDGFAVLGVDPDGLDRTVQLDFGQETSGLLELELEAPAGTVVDIGWSEGVWRDAQMGCWARSSHPDGAVAPREFCDARQGMRYVCSRRALERFNSLFIAAFRHLRVVFRCPRGGNAEITLHQLRVRAVGYPVKREGTFACADENLNRIYQAAMATMENSISDVFLDCPGRERGAWLNDSYWSAAGFQAVTTDMALERRFLRQFIDAQTTMPFDGMVPPFYPSECHRWPGIKGGHGPIMGHGLFWLLQVERHLRLHGDDQLRREWKPAVITCFDSLGRFRSNEGLLEGAPWGSFLDWSRFKIGSIQTGDNFIYALALGRLGNLYHESGWTELGRQTAASTEQAAWSDGSEMYTDTVERDEQKKLRPGVGLSALTNSIALWSEMIPRERADRTWRQLRNFHPQTVDRHLLAYETDFVRSNAYGLLYRFDYEGRIGDIAGLVRDMKEAYLPMFERGQNCLSEHLGYEGSLCHGYNGYLAHLLSRHVAGIELPDQPGEAVHIRPHPEQLPWCQARVPWMDGQVQVWWSRTPKGCRIMASVPHGQEGKLIDPITGKVFSFTTSITI